MKQYNTIFFLLLAGLLGTFFTGCSDAPDEITEVSYKRVFSVNPENMTINVINETTLRLTWNKVQNADAYTIELFANDENMLFEGEPSVIREDVEHVSPYLIPNLIGETVYSGRIKGTSKTTGDSNWIEFSFETDMENIFNPIGDGLGATTVTLSWLKGAEVTHIIASTLAGDFEIRHDLSNDEIADATATVEGLTGTTAYVATIYNGTQKRGAVSFTTNPDLGEVTQVNPEDDWKEMLQNAEPGEVFAFMPGEYSSGTTTTVAINESISIIAAYATDKPIITGALFSIQANGVNLSLTNIILDGNLSQNNVTTVTTGLTIGEISLESCEIRRYGRGFIAPGGSVNVEISSIKINDCLMHNFTSSGNEIFDLRVSVCRNITITNSTFYNLANSNHLFRIDATANNNPYTGNVEIIVDRCTFYNIVNSSSNTFFYIRFLTNNCRLSNSIIANTPGALKNNATTLSSDNNNVFYETASITETGENPGFVDPANGDFTVTDEDTYYRGIGDPRWLTGLE